jgi:N-acetylmuramoyl-L-alanine amidase
MFIVLDCGHSVKTKGKRSPDGKFLEYEYNRRVGKAIGQRLTEIGINWCFTYDTDDEEDMGLSARADVANRWSKIYGANNVILISLHHNACGNGADFVKASGFEVYSTKGDTVSDKYAEVFCEEAEKVLKPLGRKVRGHKEANFTVIKKTVCPSVLIEYGFFTNKDEMEWMMTDEGLEAYVELTVNAIKRFKG